MITQSKVELNTTLSPVSRASIIAVPEFEFDPLEAGGAVQKSTTSSSPTYPGQVFNENSIRLKIASGNASMGSEADFIYAFFGRNHKIKLNAPNGKFLPGADLLYDLNLVKDYVETIPTDAWDEIILFTPSKDGLKLRQITIVHSGETILDLTENLWLDGSKNEQYGRIGLAAHILQYKLSLIDNNWRPQLHFAAMEIGKADRRKYGTVKAWCSEFASWCLRRDLWNTPEGDTYTAEMEAFFQGRGRKKTQADLTSGAYTLNPGDYLYYQLSGGAKHSGLFVKYIDSPATPGPETRFLAIEGNTRKTVGLRTRRLKDIVSAGSTI